MSGLSNCEDMHFVVVESASVVRNNIVKGLREAGCKNVQSMDSVTNLLRYLEVERADWVFTSLQAEAPENALTLLRAAAATPLLSGLRVSLFVDVSERDVLPLAFQYGLVSYHNRNLSRDSLRQELNALFTALRETGNSAQGLAARMLVRCLEDARRVGDLVEFLTRMAQAFPDDPFPTLELTRALFKDGQRERALKLLGEAMLLGLPGWEDIKRTHLLPSETLRPSLGVKRAVVVEPLRELSDVHTRALSGAGVEDTILVQSPFDALAEIAGLDTPDLVIVRWENPEMGGSAFVQRVRESGFHDLPIQVLANAISAEDERLLKEMNVSAPLTGAVDERRLLRALVTLLKSDRFGGGEPTLVRKIRQQLRMGQLGRARHLKDLLESSSVPTSAQRTYLEAEFAFWAQEWPEAKELCFRVLKEEPGHLFALDLLGRVSARLGDFAAAAKCFSKAQEASPQCVSRICQLAHAHSNVGAGDAARAALDAGAALDPGSPMLRLAEAEYAVREGDLDAVRATLGDGVDAIETIASLNNSGVVLVKLGQIARGMACYENLLKLEPDRYLDGASDRILYNLGLAHARAGGLEQALVVLTRVSPQAARDLSLKTASLRAKISVAKRQGTPLVLDPDPPGAQDAGRGAPEAEAGAALEEERFSPNSFSWAPMAPSGDAVDLSQLIDAKAPPGARRGPTREAAQVPKAGVLGLFHATDEATMKWRKLLQGAQAIKGPVR